MNSEIVSQTPSWYILLCVALGIALATLFYFKSKVFTSSQKWALALLRGLLGFSVAYLLLNPLIKTVSSIIIKPKVVVLVDNSKSMLSGKKLKDANQSILALRKNIEDKGYEIEIRDFEDKSLTEITADNFKGKRTNFSSVLQTVKNNYEGQNLSDVILFSDGILNDGVSPTFSKYPFNVHTIGFGDSTLKKDAYIAGVSANKLAYLGNNFTVGIDIGAYILKGKTAQVSIKNAEGTLISQKSIGYESDDSFKSVDFEIPAKNVGKQRFIVELQAVSGEYSTKNNRREFIVDVINGREKILLLASSPHPDIKAIKSIAESNDLFELKVLIIDATNVSEVLKETYDILILHQFPDVGQVHTRFLGQLLSRQKPTFFILGSKTHLSYFNGMQNVVSINAPLNKVDKVTGMVNPAFNLFSISESQGKLISQLPPLTVPFGSYSVGGGGNVILDQYVSGINTSRPLLAVNLSGTRKMATFLAEGLWQWRLEEYAMTESHFNVDDIILKTLQLISIKEDKGKLRVYPIADAFDVDDKVTFVAEVYNEIFERIYNQDIKLNIKSRNGINKNYDFRVTEETSRFNFSDLPAGVYNYEATTKVLGKEEKSSGQFAISESDIELQNTVANFDFLRTLSKENNGTFVHNAIELRNALEKEDLTNKIIGQEELKDLINLRWLLVLILVLACIEWVLRKYFGSY